MPHHPCRDTTRARPPKPARLRAAAALPALALAAAAAVAQPANAQPATAQPATAQPAFAQPGVQRPPAPQPVASQGTAEVQLSELAVTGEGAGSLTAPSVAAQRAAVLSTVGSVAFVDAAAIQDRYINTLRDVLKDVPGVYVQNRYGQELRLSIRGSGLGRNFHLRGIELLQDGTPVNLADGSGDFYQIDPLAIRSVAVYKGGNALVFGTTTLGGAVDVVTPTAYTALAPNILRFEAGSFNTFRESVQASRIEGDTDALVSGTLTNSDGYRTHEAQGTRNLNANVGVRLAPGVETRFYVGAFLTDQKLPGTLSLFNALTHPTLANPTALTGNQSRKVEVERIANRTSFALDVGRLDVDTWAIHKRLVHPINTVLDQDGWTYGIAPHWGGTFDVAGFRNDTVLGLRAFAGINAAQQFVNVRGNRGAQTLEALQSASNYEAYGENRFWFLPDVALMTGVKAFSANRTYSNKGGLPTYPLPQYGNETYEGVNPKVGLLWQPLPDIQVFGDVTRSRDVPDFGDLVQTNVFRTTFVPLRAQRAWTQEAGARGRAGPLTFDVTLYRADIRDELLAFNTAAGLSLNVPSATFNAPRTRHQGVEAAVALDLTRDLSGAGDALTVAQIWTHNDFRFVDDPLYRNNRIAGVPGDVLRTVLTYLHPAGFTLSPSVDWIPQGAFADHANTLKVPGYALFNVEAAYDLAPGVRLFVDARNLLDARYVADIGVVSDARAAAGGAAGLTAFYPGVGRAVFGGVRASF